jgi:hypothetical protein
MTEPERDEADVIEQRTPVDPSLETDDPDAAADEVLLDEDERPYTGSGVDRFD